MARDYPRKLRLNAQLLRELGVLIRGTLRDPRVAMVSISAVDVSPDMRHARIQVGSLSDAHPAEEAAEVLNHAAGRLRRALGPRLHLRHIPELRFYADHSLERAERISGLIREARDADRSHAADRGEPDS